MTVCAVLLSYKRPKNMDRIIRQTLASKYVSRIVLSNNNPDVNIEEWLTMDEYRIKPEIINQPVATLYTIRWSIAAAQSGYDYFFCPDDDLYLSGDQIDQVLAELFKRPQVPHGVVGQLRCFRDGKPFLDSDVGRVDCEIDILNRCYFFTKAHVQRTLELCQLMGYQNIADTRFMDDLLLSFSGEQRPLIHHVGELQSCPSSIQKGIATWREDNFANTREDGYMRLQRITGRL